LNTDINYHLSPTAKHALQNSISLAWTLYVKIIRRRPWIWDETIADLSFRYKIRYHALLNKYLVQQENGAAYYSFSTLTAALYKLGTVRGLKIIEQGRLTPRPAEYRVAIKIDFNKETLPLPLRPFSYFDSEWYLSSNWLTWPVQK